MNKIALFTATPRSATALLIAAATNCPVSHAAVQVGGDWYHASESTGKFSKLDISKMKGRHCAVYVFDGDLSEWLKQMDGMAYDWKGIFGWGMKLIGFNQYAKGNPRKFYCFEAALDALRCARGEKLGDKRHSGYLDTQLRALLASQISFQLPGSATIYDRPISGCDIANLFQVSLGFGKFERFV